MTTQVNTQLWNTLTANQLAQVLTTIDSPAEMQSFLSDVLTEKEIIEISSRLEAAKMLSQKRKYSEIIEATKLSSRTIARISVWMQNGSGGYAQALGRLAHHSHLPPARAE